ncbi:hypothetical protein MASR2M15_16270 [Anaerolineales bacterium]
MSNDDLRNMIPGDDDDDVAWDDDDFDFDNDEDNALSYGDDEFESLDDVGFDLDDRDDPFDGDFDPDEEPPKEGGTNRAFIIIAILLVLLFGGGIILLLLALTQGGGPSELELTATRITELNGTAIAGATVTEDARQTAVVIQATEDASILLTSEAIATFDSQATLDAFETATFEANITATAVFVNQTAEAVFAIQTQQALNPEGTEEGTGGPDGLATTDPSGTSGGTGDATPTREVISPTDVALTATALADLLGNNPTATQVSGINATPTSSVTDGSGGIDNTGGTGQLPNTGLFDDLADGNFSNFFLIAIGLVGLIAVSRFLRRRK